MNNVVGSCPKINPELRTCTTLQSIINGCTVYTMIDTRSMGNFVSPAFAKVMKMRVFPLKQQLMLQLGCIGSRSKITHGGTSTIQIGNYEVDVYFDVANIDCYNCIIGIPFLRQTKVILNFTRKTIEIAGDEEHLTIIKPNKTLLKNEDIPQLQNRWFDQYKHRLSGVILKLPPLQEVNHRIPLVDEKKQYVYHLPQCADALK
ncbi:hypothetical protein PISMIDRAFT_123549, partial [Pisolithus microcarpus 441]